MELLSCKVRFVKELCYGHTGLGICPRIGNRWSVTNVFRLKRRVISLFVRMTPGALCVFEISASPISLNTRGVHLD